MGGDSVPPREWRPPQDDLSGLVVEHISGQPLDSEWVRRQFQANAVVGQGIDRAVALVQLINRAFLSAGFVNSGLLVQAADPADPNRLDIRIVHGALVPPEPGADAVAVEWAGGRSRGLDADFIRERMPSTDRRPLDAIALERDFRRLADDPAIRTVNAQLRPGGRPGEASLLLSVLPREPVDLYLTAGNNRSPSVGGERIAAGGVLRNLIESGDLLSGEAGTTEGVLDLSVAYATPWLTPRTTFSVRGSYNRAAVIDRPLVPLDIRTRDRGLEASLTHRAIDWPLTPAGEGRWSPSRVLTVGTSLAWRRQRSFLLGQPFSFAPGSVDGRAEYGAARILADYVLRSVDQVFAVSGTATTGLWGTRARLPLVLDPDRHFVSLLVQANYARRLTGDGLELRGRLTAQWSSSVLYSAERLSIGGEASVRGYRESLLLADQGVIGSAEIAQPFSLSGRPPGSVPFDWGAFSLAAFADAGWGRNAEGPQPSPRTLVAVGAALAWQPSDAIALRVAYGHALKEAVQTGSRDLQDRGVHLRLTVYPLRF
ncbi:ShlB/FhaC/HecB family hemolysin secretion/activation protein [Sphingosinicella terrae]|uniref:ShlB/FhaC/HecB family hemolysin secretion/activation protein n=1 Tax=Sphingosinicella terrae TaxID=2172047 RepID=UPI0013B383ED|nr:ShlB/FhaC/HecB family hemolysin secretion/activation protein [Sphingosinicella terrae]